MDVEVGIVPRMPDPATYEEEYKYWPWGQLLAVAANWVCEHAPRGSVILDYMCGTGFLLDSISKLRPDLKCAGCDLAEEYVCYAKSKYPHLNIACRNALQYRPDARPQVVICTAGLHHLRRDEQANFLSKVSAEMESGGLFVLGEELIPSYDTPTERKGAALKLGFAVLSSAIANGATDAVVAAAVDVLGNDLVERGEYKLSEPMLLAALEPAFKVFAVHRIWPEGDADYGDVLYLCTRR